MESREEAYEAANYFEQSIMDFKTGSSRVQEGLPEVVSSYFKFTDACFEEGALCKKQKQLTALGISIHAQDEYCIMYHAKGAADHGATEKEILEVIAISTALGGGAAFAQGATLALDTFDHYKSEKH